MRLDERIRLTERKLADAGIREPRLEAASLVSFVIGRDRTFLIAHPEYEISSAEAAKLDDATARREAREPFQYITGKQEFFGREFLVRPGVLIPRPETEILVEAAIERVRDIPELRFCEIGVGSGCIGISLLCELGGSRGSGLEISTEAIETAIENAGRLGVSDRFEIKRSDLFSALNNDVFDLIVSNPPYISQAEMATLQPEVGLYEPHHALTDGENGTAIIEQIIRQSPEFLRPGGWLLIEIGQGQDERIAKMLDPGIWEHIEFLPDLQGIPRTMAAQLKAAVGFSR